MGQWVYNIIDLMGESYFIRQIYHVMIDTSGVLLLISSFCEGSGETRTLSEKYGRKRKLRICITPKEDGESSRL